MGGEETSVTLGKKAACVCVVLLVVVVLRGVDKHTGGGSALWTQN